MLWTVNKWAMSEWKFKYKCGLNKQSTHSKHTILAVFSLRISSSLSHTVITAIWHKVFQKIQQHVLNQVFQRPTKRRQTVCSNFYILAYSCQLHSVPYVVGLNTLRKCLHICNVKMAVVWPKGTTNKQTQMVYI